MLNLYYKFKPPIEIQKYYILSNLIGGQVNKEHITAIQHRIPKDEYWYLLFHSFQILYYGFHF
jgi:hypothetical protein